jgi:hypothetical protein
MFSVLMEGDTGPDPEVRREDREDAAGMVAAREAEEKENLEALRELLGDYDVDDLLAGAGEPGGKRKGKKALGTGKLAFPQVGVGSGVSSQKESDGEFFRRSKRLRDRVAKSLAKVHEQPGLGGTAVGGGVAKSSAKSLKAKRAATAARIAAELSKEAFGEGSYSWADDMDLETTNPADGVNSFTVAHSVGEDSVGARRGPRKFRRRVVEPPVVGGVTWPWRTVWCSETKACRHLIRSAETASQLGTR